MNPTKQMVDKMGYVKKKWEEDITEVQDLIMVLIPAAIERLDE